MPVIMGRKTYESVNKPLPGRFNIVVTRQAEWKADGVITATDIDTAIQKAEETNCKEVFVIGGGEIFKQVMDRADKIYITRVHADIEGDVFFPEIDKSKWQLVSNEDLNADAKHLYPYSFQQWERI